MASSCPSRHRGAAAMDLRYPMAMSLSQGHEVTKKNVSKPRHRGTTSGAPWSCSECPRTRTWAHQDKGGHPRPCREKVGGAEQCTGGHEEGDGQEKMMNPPPIKDCYYKNNNKNEWVSEWVNEWVGEWMNEWMWGWVWWHSTMVVLV